MDVGSFDSKIHLPKNILLVGGTQCGKSYFLKRMIEENDALFTPRYQHVIYCYGAWQSMYEELQNELGSRIDFRQDIPTKDEIIEISQTIKGPILMCIDDKMSTALVDGKKGSEVLELVCVTAHHYNVSCVIILQNLFHNKLVREISLNTHFLILFKNQRNHSQIRVLASQIMPDNRDFFIDSYNKATNEIYGYLFIDLSPTSNRKYQLRTNIFKGEQLIIFTPKK